MASIKDLRKRLVKHGTRATVSRGELVGRVRRKLEAQGRTLRHVPGSNPSEEERYCIVGPGVGDLEGPVDVEELGRKLRVLEPWEAVMVLAR
jgi:hypothetical protein